MSHGAMGLIGLGRSVVISLLASCAESMLPGHNITVLSTCD